MKKYEEVINGIIDSVGNMSSASIYFALFCMVP